MPWGFHSHHHVPPRPSTHSHPSDYPLPQSAPPSRPASPSQTLRDPYHSSSLNITSSHSPVGTPSSEYPPGEPYSSTPLSDHFPPSTPSSYAPSSLLHSQSFLSTSSSSYGMGHHHLPPLEIILDQEPIVLRGAGSDTNPGLLSGTVVLNLAESTNIKELTMRLEGKGKVNFVELSGATGTKSHHFTHPILTHDWSFLDNPLGNMSTSSSSASLSKKSSHHSHTLKAGRHAFPFSLTLSGSLPSSIRTYYSDGRITYQLKATAVRGALSSNFHAVKDVRVVRSFTPEALEFTQTLEIENTWPGKVMYCLTLPHKAYAAGDEIPISIKFMPLAKGTRVTSITSVIKEYSMVYTRHSSHTEGRVAATSKHEIRDGRAYRVHERGMESHPPIHHQEEMNASGGHAQGGWSASPSAPSSPVHRAVRDSVLGGVGTPGSEMGGLSRIGSWANLPGAATSGGLGTPRIGSSAGRDGYFPNAVAGSSSGPSGGGTVSDIPDDLREQEEMNIGDEEIDTMITVPIPAWTTPSHSIHPIQVTHKIKWSCSISNPDGHVSELRCALPICILAHPLLEEAHVASSGTRALLFGGGGDEAPQVDLPSYNDHVYDRVATTASGTASSYIRSGNRTPGSGTPPASRGPSRPGSPVRGMSRGHTPHTPGSGGHTPGEHDHPEGIPIDGVPVRPGLSNWADSELLLSLGALATANNSNPTSGGSSPHDQTPSESRNVSRPGSRMGFGRSGRSSQPGSRSGSRANSPERERVALPATPGGSSGGSGPDVVRPTPRSGGLPGVFHGHGALGMKAFTSIGGRHQAQRGASGSGQNSTDHSPMHSPVLLADRLTATSLPRSGFSLGSHAAFGALSQVSRPSMEHRASLGGGGSSGGDSGAITPPAGPHPVDAISQVPSYEIASRGFLGGGVVPISAGPPTYFEAERAIERTRSESALDQIGRAAGEVPTLTTAILALEAGVPVAGAVAATGDGPGAEGSLDVSGMEARA